MENVRKSKRVVAGVNKSLSADFVWPGRFGNGKENTETVRSEHTSVLGDKQGPEKEVSADKLASRAMSKNKTLSSRYSELNLARKRLEIENEKKKQELEMQKQELEMQKKVIENDMRILKLEHELRKEELESCSSYSKGTSRRSENLVPQTNQNNDYVINWVENIEVDIDTVRDFCLLEHEENLPEILPEKSQNSDIKMLCDTITNVLKNTSSSSANQNDKMLARQILDKDFPYFDGSPEVWPLFYKHFKNICTLCGYSNEEIIIKLQKCLKGDAKAAVSGMMLSGDNVKLIIHTLKIRFGRPELILDTMISKIKVIPYIKETNLEKLIQFSGEVNNLVCTIKTLKCLGHLQNPQLIRELLSKIPDVLKLKWGEVVAENETQGKEVNLDDFGSWLGKMAHAACFVSTPKQLQSQKLYDFKKPDRVFSTKEAKEQSYADNSDEKVEVVCAMKHSTRVLLRMIPVTLYGPSRKLNVLALCDEASTVTLLDATIARNLDLKGKKETLCLQWTNDEINTQENSMSVKVKVSKPGENRTFDLKGVRTIENLSLPEQTINMEEWRKHPHLNDTPINDIKNEKPVILIGQDNIDLIVVRHARTGPTNLPIATKCLLGWSLHGPCSEVKDREENKVYTFHICEKRQDEDLNEILRKSYSTDMFGIMALPKKLCTEDVRALQIMENTARRVGDRYEIGLLWRSDDSILPNNKVNALQRLKCTERKCRKNQLYAKEYQLKIESHVEKGFVRKLTIEEANIEGPRIWYLPHFGVINPNKPGKLRLVFDAAAKFQNVSLNDVLMSGPDLLQSLVEILYKFRQKKVAFCGDVKEMFHQVRIREEDRCAQRFLWRDLQYDRAPDVYEMVVMIFGATCSPVCAQFIKNLTAEKYSKDPGIQNAIIKKFYVDDYLDSKDSEEEALETIAEVRRVLNHGGFEVVNWMTNAPKIREKLSEELLLVTSKNIDDSALHRVLGLWWDAGSDEFLFKLNLPKIDAPTKRTVLKSVMSLFDPLGFIASFTIRGKILMQEIWRAEIEWDEKLPEKLKETWEHWEEDLKKITEIRIPRCYSFNIPYSNKLEIHAFSDSSEEAFASVVYLRIVTSKNIDVMFVAAKTRVAPLKPLSIPRLELQAAVLSSRLVNTIKNELELKIDQIYYWTDSCCVLKWIRGDGRKYKQFVAHRIGEIQEITNVDDWRWVPTDLNIADKATRSKAENDRNQVIPTNWIFGPDFLKQKEEFWPTEKQEVQYFQDNESEEIKKEYICLINEYNENLQYLPDIKRFSKFMKLIRTTAWCIRFIRKIKDKHCPRSSNLLVEELEEAEILWVKRSQTESFYDEIERLKNSRMLNRRSRLLSLNPELREGILRLGGRVKLANCMEEAAKQPILLNPKHEFTKLLVQHFHEKLNHRGVELVLNELRQKYWIIDGRASVKAAFSRCQKCKNERAKPLPPKMGLLPLERLNRQIRPFVEVGMDYFGPIFVSVGRRKEKRWGVLFTCMSVRAIHLEIAHSLTSDSAIMAIRRMTARRGQPRSILCDNGTNFVGAERELREALEEMKKSNIKDTLTVKGIDFKFACPVAPHMSGVWERLIKTVKKTIGKVLYQQSIRDETLATLFAEAENIVNSRPLTKVSCDPNDLEALTPNHFIMGSSNGEASPVLTSPNVTFLRSQWKRSQMLTDSFWARWVKEYLPTLNKRNKWTNDEKSIQIDDVVVIIEDNLPRHRWKLGRIMSTYPGPDGRVRVVDVKTASGLFRRPVTRLCRLELETSED